VKNNFNVKEHIDNRKVRHKQANINSKFFPGLSTIELNITELCNRTCSFCPRHDPKIYPNQKLFMSIETVKKLTDELASSDWYGDIHIAGFGEPHTHPYLLKIVETLKQYDKLFIEIITNGDRLIDVDLNYTQSLFDSGLDLLTVDCYDSHSQYDKRLKAMKVLPNKYRLRQHYDIGDTANLINEYGFNNRSGIMGGEGVQRPCYLPFYKALIDWNGDLMLCANDWHRKSGSMGNIIKSSFKTCWNSDKLKNIRKNLEKGIRLNACTNCNINGMLYGLESFLLHETL
jgi:radical SAM protein with 4Fe4S-binding SPASM domain